MIEIKQLLVITADVLSAFKRLVPQLSDNCTLPGYDDLNGIIHSGNSVLFVAEDDGVIIGTLTLVRYRIPTGWKAWIEDVVVDKSMRGRGTGRMLTQHAIDYAKNSGIGRIDLTSSPFRVAANEMYRNMGFQKRETNVYRLTLD